MIVSASYKTDIPAFHGAWFLERLRAGHAWVRNPYGGPPFRVGLTAAEAAGIIFWTRHMAPLAPHLPEVRARGLPFVVHYTVLGYPAAIDRAVIAPERAVADIHALAEAWGPRAVVWRYDPILFTSRTPAAWHLDTFGRLAEALRGAVDEAVVSFAQIYRKSGRALTRAAQAGAFTWDDPADGEKTALLAALRPIAQANALRLSLCAQRDLLVEGVADAACIDARRLEDVAGQPLRAARKAHRKGCGCWQSRDIGAYDTCPQGCVYCYAVRSREAAKARLAAADPTAAVLG
jgi:hypothetical protein